MWFRQERRTGYGQALIKTTISGVPAPLARPRYFCFPCSTSSLSTFSFPFEVRPLIDGHSARGLTALPHQGYWNVAIVIRASLGSRSRVAIPMDGDRIVQSLEHCGTAIKARRFGRTGLRSTQAWEADINELCPAAEMFDAPCRDGERNAPNSSLAFPPHRSVESWDRAMHQPQ